MEPRNRSRRAYLAALGAVGVAGIAGCAGNTAGTDNEGTNTGRGTPDRDTDGAAAPRKTVPDFGGYLDGANNYNGTTVDKTGQDEATVTVGAGGEVLAFDPAAIHVDNGATVQWEWTGKGGAHNVVADDGSFESGTPVQTTGVAFEHTFEEDGIYNYHCLPHQGSGMLGAVVVGTDYPSYTYTPPAHRWEFEMDGELHSAPTVSDGTVYVDRGTVYALDAATGTVQWSAKQDSEPGHFAPVVADDTVYVGGNGLSALDAATGRQQWRTEIGRKAPGSPTVVDGTAYVEAANVQAIDTATGTQKWAFEPDGYGPSELFVVDGTVYFDSYWEERNVSVIYAVDAATGAVQWRIEVAPLGPSLAVRDGMVYTTTYDEVSALDATTGEQRWTHKTNCRMDHWTALHVTDGTVVVGCPNGSVYSFDSATGEREWTLTLDGRMDSLVVNGTTIYAGTDGGDGGRLYGIDVASGRRDVIYEGRGDVTTITSTTAYFGGSFPAAVDLQSGDRNWLFRPGSSRTLLAVSEGTAFVGTENGTVYALTNQ